MIATETRDSTYASYHSNIYFASLQTIHAFLDEETDGANSSKTAQHVR